MVSLRTTDAKLTLWPGHPEWSEMFDLTSDRYELTNQFYRPVHQARCDALRTEFDRQMRDTGLLAELTGLKLSNGVSSLSIPGGLEPRYELQRSADMQSWTPIGEIKMDGLQASMTDTNAGPAHSYYRVQWVGD